MKICSKCKIEKSYNEFRKASKHKDGYEYHCKECVEGRPIHKKVLEGVKICTKCNIEKDCNEFSILKSKKGMFRHSICKKCKSIYRSIKRKENPLKEAYRKRVQKLRNKYGLEIKDYDKMFDDQNGNCKICNNSLIKPHIDHCHSTNKIKGILCGNCNIGLGMFKDNPEYLENAIKYLKENC